MTERPSIRFETLDGMRGVAAIVVLIFHGMGISLLRLPHGYLAVDLFFMLSGFVLAAVYTPRFVEGMRIGKFLLIRAKRLYPLYLAGLLLGFFVRMQQDIYYAIKSLVFGIFTLPTPGPAVAYLYYVNVPSWSLFCELLINIVFVLWLWKARTRTLLILAAAAAVAMLYAYYVYGNLKGGAHVGDMWVGLARVTFAFPLGIVLYRIHRLCGFDRFRLKPSLIGASLPLVLLIGFVGLHDLFVVLLIFPAMVLAGASFEPKYGQYWALLGSLSYPLYCLHDPILRLLRYIVTRTPYPELLGTSGMLVVILVCWHIGGFLDRHLYKSLQARLRWMQEV